jgi:hypothetical protein
MAELAMGLCAQLGCALGGVHVMAHAEAAAEITNEESAGHREKDDENTDDARGFAIAHRD